MLTNTPGKQNGDLDRVNGRPETRKIGVANRSSLRDVQERVSTSSQSAAATDRSGTLRDQGGTTITWADMLQFLQASAARPAVSVRLSRVQLTFHVDREKRRMRVTNALG